MSYRNGTYIAFHAEGKTDPTASDIRYYRMLKAWHEQDSVDFKFVNSHDKVAACRDSSSRQTIMRSLRLRLDNSKNMVFIVGSTTKDDTDFVPYEIQYSVDTCGIPIIVAYTGYETIMEPAGMRSKWPKALAARIDASTVRAIHIPFKRRFIDMAIRQFTLSSPPADALTYYNREAHIELGAEF